MHGKKWLNQLLILSIQINMDITLKIKENHFSSAQEIFEAILESRGYKTQVAQETFLSPPPLTLDYLLKQSGLATHTLSTAKKILNQHLKNNADICIFGDYDADGVSSTALLYISLIAYAKIHHSHSRILPFIPDRHKHGYGLSNQAVSDVISSTAFHKTSFPDFAPKLIITVDTGIVAHEGINTFIRAGVEVIVTDHHLPMSAGLPDASCIVHTTTTSGAGVAWILALYLLGEPALSLLDIATIGVVADMMPLLGLNRSLAKYGLTALSRTKRHGLLAMKKQMGVEAKDLTAYDISFGIAPRINAAGRIYNPLDALRLLVTSSSTQARDLAQVIEAHNKDRQEYTDSALKSAVATSTQHKIIVNYGDYHEGVIGLVAGKLVEMFHKPALVLSNSADIIKGSARSLPGINITDLLRSLKTPFLGLGGHDQAAGFSLAKKDFQKFQKEIESVADRSILDALLTKSYVADLSLDFKYATLTLAKMIRKMEPFGLKNQNPKFYVQNVTVIADKRLGKEGKHAKLQVEQDGVIKTLMIWNCTHAYPLKHLVSLIYSLDINVYKGVESLVLIASYAEI